MAGFPIDFDADARNLETRKTVVFCSFGFQWLSCSWHPFVLEINSLLQEFLQPLSVCYQAKTSGFDSSSSCALGWWWCMGVAVWSLQVSNLYCISDRSSFSHWQRYRYFKLHATNMQIIICYQNELSFLIDQSQWSWNMFQNAIYSEKRTWFFWGQYIFCVDKKMKIVATLGSFAT